MARLSPLLLGQLRECEDGLQRIHEMVGYLPNALATMARKPTSLNTLMALVGNVFRDPGRFETGFKFMLAYVASHAAGCAYSSCHAAHAAHEAGETDDRINALADWEASEKFSPREKAALALAKAAGTLPVDVQDCHFEALQVHFDEEEIVEIAMSIAIFGWFNRWNSMMRTDLEQAPYEYVRDLMGAAWSHGRHRVPDTTGEKA